MLKAVALLLCVNVPLPVHGDGCSAAAADAAAGATSAAHCVDLGESAALIQRSSRDPSSLDLMDSDYLDDADNPLERFSMGFTGNREEQRAHVELERIARSELREKRAQRFAMALKGDKGAALVQDEFDCKEEVEHWKMGWSDNKKAYCCNKAGVGCDEEDHGQVGKEKTQPHTEHEETEAAPSEGEFDCKEGMERWKLGWSDAKKAYCCKKARLGCAEGDAAQFIKQHNQSSNESIETNGTNTTCVTRADPRTEHRWYATASPPGTPCVFGVDDRDEGSHCIFEQETYGSLGWCWTSTDKTTFGACSESCPLYGPSAVLGNEIRKMGKELKEVIHEEMKKVVGNTSQAVSAAVDGPAANGTKPGEGEETGKEAAANKEKTAEDEKADTKDSSDKQHGTETKDKVEETDKQGK